MLRKLLACLALLTGLTAAGAPAQAEVAIAMASRVEASATREAGSQLVSAAAIVLPRKAEPAIAAAPSTIVDRPAHQPAVRLGSDRARE